MKAKFLITAALCLALPIFAACGNNNNQADVNDDSGASAEMDDRAEQEDSGDASEQTDNDEQTDAENADETDEVTIMYITINSNKLEVELAENSSVSALIEILEQGDITYTADDYGNFEKVGNIGYTLPRNDEQITTEAGDVILYQGSNICLYYGVNSWSFTRIGKINGYSASEIKTLLCAGEGEIKVTLSLK